MPQNTRKLLRKAIADSVETRCVNTCPNSLMNTISMPLRSPFVMQQQFGGSFGTVGRIVCFQALLTKQ